MAPSSCWPLYEQPNFRRHSTLIWAAPARGLKNSQLFVARWFERIFGRHSDVELLLILLTCPVQWSGEHNTSSVVRAAGCSGWRLHSVGPGSILVNLFTAESA